MQMETIGAVAGAYENRSVVQESGSASGASVASAGQAAETITITPITNQMQNEADLDSRDGKGQEQGKEPAKSSMEAAMSLLNSQIAKTHCAYSYDEDTKRVSIKIYDDETDELIREVPPEKSLEALKKMWEIAGIIVDEKR